MKLAKSVFSLLALAAHAIAANHNPVASPNWGATVNAGDIFPINWLPTTNKNVNLILREGDAKSLSTIYTIASNIPNTGTYSWEVPGSIVTRTDYTIEIQDASDPSITNYSPYFRVLAVGQGITASEKELSEETKTIADKGTHVSSIQNALHSPGYVSSTSQLINAVATETTATDAADSTGESESTLETVSRETGSTTKEPSATGKTTSGSTTVTTKTREGATTTTATNSTVSSTSRSSGASESAGSTATKTTTSAAKSSASQGTAPRIMMALLGAFIGFLVLF